MKESKLHSSVAKYLNLVSMNGRFRWLHIPNGGHKNRIMGKNRKRLGARAGAPDILIQVRGGLSIEIELKTDKGRLSKSQKERMRESLKMRIPYFVCRSVDEVQSVLRGAGLI